jgi:hypothetical protein
VLAKCDDASETVTKLPTERTQYVMQLFDNDTILSNSGGKSNTGPQFALNTAAECWDNTALDLQRLAKKYSTTQTSGRVQNSNI